MKPRAFYEPIAKLAFNLRALCVNAFRLQHLNFKGHIMKFVVKLGGAALENPALLQTCARSIAELAKDGHQVALVHGGGVQLTKLLAQMGKKS